MCAFYMYVLYTYYKQDKNICGDSVTELDTAISAGLTPNCQLILLGVAKSSTYLFLKQPQDKEHFIIELLDFGIIKIKPFRSNF